ALAAVQVGGAESGQDRHAAVEVTPDHRGREIFEAQPATLLQKFDICLGGGLELGCRLDRGLRLELRDQIDAVDEPGRVEDLKVVGVDGGTVAPRQGVAPQQDGKGPAVLQAPGHCDHLLHAARVAQVRVDALQTGRPAGAVVRLRQDVDFEPQLHCVNQASLLPGSRVRKSTEPWAMVRGPVSAPLTTGARAQVMTSGTTASGVSTRKVKLSVR